MKKAPKLASILLGISFLGTAIPANTNFPREEISLEETLEQKVEEQSNEDYSYREVSKMVHQVYKSGSRKPDYLSENFLREIIRKESSYDTKAISEKGARGLMQLMPDTWGDIEKTLAYEDNVFNPKANLEVGMKYILFLDKFCRNKYPGWESLTPAQKRSIILASYNGGISRLNDMGWDIELMPKETKGYVKDIEDKMN